ncbi:MAG: 3-phosphoshikimate 1-carboxyvinyltransferase [Anaerovoracaceae bacterium]|jgi:3-phosphoshikimate 1-carboxyvinyltransferase
MDINITPGKLSGSIRAIPSGSHAQRVFICAALADRPTDVLMKGDSKDVEILMKCLRSLGAHIKVLKEDRFRVEPISKKGNKKTNVVLQCGDSASTFRFLLPVAAAIKENVTLEGDGRLVSLPMEPIKEALSRQGCRITGEGMPLSIKGRLKPGVFHLPGEISAQWVTGLILAATTMKGDSEIILDVHLEEEDYVDLTRDVLERYGVDVYEQPKGYIIPGKQNFKAPREIRIEGDWITSAFWMAANALGNKINCEGLNQRSVQGNRRILTLLQSIEDGGVIDCSHIPDLVAPLGVVAAVTPGTIRFENCERLRLKEIDRLDALINALVAIGANISESGNGFTVQGRESLEGGPVDAMGDYSIGMAMAIAATCCREEMTIIGGEGIEKIYINFFDEYKKLGGKVKING